MPAASSWTTGFKVLGKLTLVPHPPIPTQVSVAFSASRRWRFVPRHLAQREERKMTEQRKYKSILLRKMRFPKARELLSCGDGGLWPPGAGLSRADSAGRGVLSGIGFAGRFDRAPSLPWHLPPSCAQTCCSVDTGTEWGLGAGPNAEALRERPCPSLLTPQLLGLRGVSVGESPQTSDTLDSAGSRRKPDFIR